jgi:F-type H+-transporting ATPase subunit b
MPQLNPEFYISQLFWLVISFTFLFIFLWRISLPRISIVLKNRESRINEDIKMSKKLQSEAEEIQIKIENQLREAKLEASDLIKKANHNFQDKISNELDKLDKQLSKKIEESSSIIEQNKIKSINEVQSQIYQITKLTLSKISTIKVSDIEVKDVVDNIHKKEIN